MNQFFFRPYALFFLRVANFVLSDELFRRARLSESVRASVWCLSAVCLSAPSVTSAKIYSCKILSAAEILKLAREGAAPTRQTHVAVPEILLILLTRIACTQCIDADCCHRYLYVEWSVRLSVSHDREPCKNGGTDRDAVWMQNHMGPRNHVLAGSAHWGPPG